MKIKHQEQLLNCLESDQSASSVPGTPSDGPDTPASGPSPSDFQQIPGPSSSPIEIEEINWETRGTDSTNQMAYFRPIKGQNQFFKDRSQVNISPVASPFMLRTPQTPDTTKETQKSYQKSYTAQLRIVCQKFLFSEIFILEEKFMTNVKVKKYLIIYAMKLSWRPHFKILQKLLRKKLRLAIKIFWSQICLLN